MKHLMICIVLAALLCGCSKVAVRTTESEVSKLAGLSTYSWLKTPFPPGDDVRVNDSRVIDAVMKAVDENMSKKGYQKVENGSADMLVTWFGAIKTKVQMESIDRFYSTYGYGAVFKVETLKSGEGTTARKLEEGTILVDILDSSSQKLLWRGSGTSQLLQGGKPDERDLYINKVVSEILKNLPPASN